MSLYLQLSRVLTSSPSLSKSEDPSQLHSVATFSSWTASPWNLKETESHQEFKLSSLVRSKTLKISG